jgi:hypothetical protein
MADAEAICLSDGRCSSIHKAPFRFYLIRGSIDALAPSFAKDVTTAAHLRRREGAPCKNEMIDPRQQQGLCEFSNTANPGRKGAMAIRPLTKRQPARRVHERTAGTEAIL